MDKEPFNLADFMTDSLCLPSNIIAPARNTFPTPHRDPLAKLDEQDPLEILGERSYGEPTVVPDDVVGTSIQEFYRGKKVFITGGTGFLGKGLTEKLIRSAPHISHVYLLIRGKKDKTYQERFTQLLTNKVFSRMKAEVPDYAAKVSPVEGDITQPRLGLSDSDYQMLIDHVHVVFHSAADVRFNKPLRQAVESNVLGARRVLRLAKEMKHLTSYVHVSTAFSQCCRRVVEENVPKLPVHYNEILDYVASTTDDKLEKETDRIILGWPNTYSFTKALCEDMMQEEAKGLPYCIFRPSVVVSSIFEPVCGWADNINGAMGFLVMSAFGIIHCYKVHLDQSIDLVPIDIVVNCAIAASWSTANYRNNEGPLVFNCVSNFFARLNWKRLLNICFDIRDIFPFPRAIWYPSVLFINSHVSYSILNIFFHKIPGFFIDKILQFSGQQPMLMKTYNTLDKLENSLSYFKSREWEFKNENVLNMWRLMSNEDKTKYNFDVNGYDINELFALGKLGIRRYYFNEDVVNNAAIAKRRNTWKQTTYVERTIRKNTQHP